RADGTARATLWETRSSPGLNQNPEEPNGTPGFFALAQNCYAGARFPPMQICTLHLCRCGLTTSKTGAWEAKQLPRLFANYRGLYCWRGLSPRLLGHKTEYASLLPTR